MSICVDCMASHESIVVVTRGSIYELTVLRGDRGEVLVRGGRQFPELRQVWFLGSMAQDGSCHLLTIDIGLRMKFALGNTFVVTSPVRSLSRADAGAASPPCAAVSVSVPVASETRAPSLATHGAAPREDAGPA